jgi:hypothetical protein
VKTVLIITPLVHGLIVIDYICHSDHTTPALIFICGSTLHTGVSADIGNMIKHDYALLYHILDSTTIAVSHFG